MKKIISLALTACLCIALCFSLTACNNKNKVKVLAFELTAEDYAFAINKENTALKDQVNELIVQMKNDGSLEKLINSYFDGTATFKYKNPSSKNGCFVVSTNAYFPPFESIEGDSFVGIDIEIASKIAEKVGKPLYIDNIDFDSVTTSVVGKMADIGMAGITVNEERKKTVDFAESYYSSAQVIVVRNDDKTFDDCTTAEQAIEILKAQSKDYKVGAQLGTTGSMFSEGNEDFEYEGFKNLTTKNYKTGALAITDLANGQINAVIIDKQPAIMIAKSVNG